MKDKPITQKQYKEIKEMFKIFKKHYLWRCTIDPYYKFFEDEKKLFTSSPK